MIEFVLENTRKPVFIAPEAVESVRAPYPTPVRTLGQGEQAAAPADFPTIITMKSGDKFTVCGTVQQIGNMVALARLKSPEIE